MCYTVHVYGGIGLYAFFQLLVGYSSTRRQMAFWTMETMQLILPQPIESPSTWRVFIIWMKHCSYGKILLYVSGTLPQLAGLETLIYNKSMQ